MRKKTFEILKKHFAQKKFYLLTCDIGFGLLEELQKDFAEYFINVGANEKNALGVAAGLSSSQDKKVFVYNIGPFLTTEALSFIRNDIHYHQGNICLINGGESLDYFEQGMSHYNLEDLNLISMYSSIDIYHPYQEDEIRSCLDDILNRVGPSYLRLSRFEYGGRCHEAKGFVHKKEGKSDLINLGSGRRYQLFLDSLEDSPESYSLAKIGEEEVDQVLGALKSKQINVYEDCLFPGPIYKLLRKKFSGKVVSYNKDFTSKNDLSFKKYEQF